MDECRPSLPVKWMHTSDDHGRDILMAFQAHFGDKYINWSAGSVTYMLDRELKVGTFSPETTEDTGEVSNHELRCVDPIGAGGVYNAMRAIVAGGLYHSVTISYSPDGQYMFMDFQPYAVDVEIYNDWRSFLEDHGVPSP